MVLSNFLFHPVTRIKQSMMLEFVKSLEGILFYRRVINFIVVALVENPCQDPVDPAKKF